MTQERIKSDTVDEAAKEAKIEFHKLVLKATQRVDDLIHQAPINGGIFSSQLKDQLEASLKILEIAYKSK